MKHLHKIISLTLAVAMLICVLNIGVFADASAASAYIKSETGMTGDIINVDVWFSSENVGAVSIDVDYVPEDFKVVSCYTFIAGMKFKQNSTNIVAGKNTVRFTGTVEDTKNISASGIIMRIELKVLKSSGFSPLTLHSLAYKADGTKLSVLDSSADINIIKPINSVEFSADTRVADVYSKYKNISNTVVLRGSNGDPLNFISTVRNGDTISINGGEKVQLIVPGT